MTLQLMIDCLSLPLPPSLWLQVMRVARPGVMEFELEATFLFHIYKHGGCRRAAYTSICE